MKKNGFTIVELICCISILAIILSFSFIDSNKFLKIKISKEFQVTSQRLLYDLRYAQLYALTEGLAKIRINDDGYIVYNPRNLDQMIITTVKFPHGISFDRVNSTLPIDRIIAFTDIGSITPYACTITIKDSLGNLSSISIKVATLTIGYKRVNV